MNALIYLTSPFKVWTLASAHEKLLAEKFPRMNFLRARNAEEAKALLPKAEVLYAWSLPRKHWARAGRLQWFHTPLAGVDEVLHPDLVSSSVRITCSRGVSSAALADHAMGLILAHSRGIASSLRDSWKPTWPRDRFFDGRPMPTELDGKVMGILGFGDIGVELARRGRGFGMRIHALKRNRTHPVPEVDRLFGPEELSEFLGEVDFLVVAVPLTRETHGMLGDKALGELKRGAFLVNIARGKVVQEKALIDALSRGTLGGAALDVHAHEPLSPSSPLHQFPNVILTPHIGGLHPKYLDRSTSIFVLNLGRFLRGEPLLHEVDKQSGY